MVPASLSKLAFWTRARRWKKYAYDPLRAPHRPLVSELVKGHLPPLTLRLRWDHVEELITEILSIETTPIPLVEETRPRQLLLLMARTRQVLLRLENEQVLLQRRFTRFSEMYSRLEDPEQQRFLIAQYLINTVTNPKALKGDLEAISRFLGYDVLRERTSTQLAHISITVETGMEFIGLAARTCLTWDNEGERLTLKEILEHTHADIFLAERLEKGDRWQARLAAGTALFHLYHSGLHEKDAAPWHRGAPDEEPDPDLHDPERVLVDNYRAVVEHVERSAKNVEEHPWTQAKALELLLALDPNHALNILNDRLFGEKPEDVVTDFLFRRLAVDLASQHLRVLHATSLLVRMVERPDPSEHVRIGVCQALTRLPPDAAISTLSRLVGVEPAVSEDSARVRASAVIALRQVAVSGELDAGARETVVTAFATVLENDSDLLVLEITCEELPFVAEVFGRSDHQALIERWVPRWKSALLDAICSMRTPPRIADVAAGTVEALERYRHPERNDLTEFLGQITPNIGMGKRRRISWRKFPGDLAERGKRPLELGRALAELSRNDWGLHAHVGKHALTLWRGDDMRFHLWRAVHEWRNPAPNKRQGYVHTWARMPHGELRAPPGGLEEVTPTTVPGERTYVDEAGGWGRYLPLMDDILHLPIWRPRPLRIFTAHGVTTVTPPASFAARLKNRIRMTFRYPALAALRMTSLGANEAGERFRFVQTLRDKYGIDVTFTGYNQIDDHEDKPHTSQRIVTLFLGKAGVPGAEAEAAEAAEPGAEAAEAGEPGAEAAGTDEPGAEASEPAGEPVKDSLDKPSNPGSGPAMAVLLPALLPVFDRARDWLSQYGSYFLSLSENSQTALAIFLTLFLGWFFVFSHFRRRWLARAREGIPLSIGGWGTRGKSGTERLKAGLFHGLGYHVVAKTTGCEAMFINAQPGQEAIEIFLYRPYDKATIWEQADVLALAQGVDAEVFMWECMALNPRYVGLLQHEWMKDDVSTLTNAYPDHEDIQGPAGADVAKVIATFIPPKSVLISSETNFLPLFAEIAKQRKTDFTSVPAREGDLIAGDVLALFPYNEHPRNISLVGSMAEKVGIDRDLAIVTMGQNVVPDLGVLKSYGPACVHGRLCTFVNGMSANERTGFLNNWRRMGFDKLDADADPAQRILTVVNNRADRISRSKVFADILVGDVAVDRHVLIGTNLKGLHSYLNTALDVYLSEKRLVQASDYEEAEPEKLPLSRLAREMKRFRIPTPSSSAAAERFALYASAANLVVKAGDLEDIAGRVEAFLSGGAEGSIRVEEVIESLESDKEFTGVLRRALEQAEVKPHEWVETTDPPKHEHVIEHFLETVAKMMIRRRLQMRLREAVASRSGADQLQSDFETAYRALFTKYLVTVHDPGTTGDQIIEICANSVPPGSKVALLGTQNIKGTGLDFVYRWIAIDKVLSLLGQVSSNRPDQRMAGLSSLEGYEDYGLYGAGLARATLNDSRFAALSPQEESLRERVLHKVEGIIKHKRSQSDSSGGSSPIYRVVGWIEGWIDYLDSIRRRRQSRQLMKDLTNQRVSLARAAIEMRAVVGRQKGGWLIKAITGKK